MSNELYLYRNGLYHEVHRTKLNIASEPIVLIEDTESLLNMLCHDDYQGSLLLPAIQEGVFFELPVDHTLMLYMDDPMPTVRLVQWVDGEPRDIRNITGAVGNYHEVVQTFLSELIESLAVHQVVHLIKTADTSRKSIAKPNPSTQPQC